MLDRVVPNVGRCTLELSASVTGTLLAEQRTSMKGREFGKVVRLIEALQSYSLPKASGACHL